MKHTNRNVRDGSAAQDTYHIECSCGWVGMINFSDVRFNAASGIHHDKDLQKAKKEWQKHAPKAEFVD